MRCSESEKNNLHIKIIALTLSIFMMLPLLISCAVEVNLADPEAEGYDCIVIYDSLGGNINQSKIRTSYYMKNSFLYEPSGTAGFYIAPKYAGHYLVGWYTAKEDITDESNDIIGYSFKNEDRWDFNLDRVEESMTLYANWKPYSNVVFIDPTREEAEQVVFTKQIPETGIITPLSNETVQNKTLKNTAFYDFYEDEAMTIPFVFSSDNEANKINDENIYKQLSLEYPEIIKPIPDFKWNSKTNRGEYPEIAEETNPDFEFVKNFGLYFRATDKEAIDAIIIRKNQIFAEAVEALSNDDLPIYMKFIKGNYIIVNSVESLKRDGKYYLDGKRYDAAAEELVQIDGYIFKSDIDFSGIKLEECDEFSGKILGRGYTISNLNIVMTSRKTLTEDNQPKGIFKSLKNAEIVDLNFESITVEISERATNPLLVGLLAATAENSIISNCTFTDVLIRTGIGEKLPVNLEHPMVTKIGDIFGSETDCIIEDLTINNCVVDIEGSVLYIGTRFATTD